MNMHLFFIKLGTQVCVNHNEVSLPLSEMIWLHLICILECWVLYGYEYHQDDKPTKTETLIYMFKQNV